MGLPPWNRKRVAAWLGATVLSVWIPVAIDQAYFRYNAYILPIVGFVAILLYTGLALTSVSISKRIRALHHGFGVTHPLRYLLSVAAIGGIMLIMLGGGEGYAIHASREHVAELKKADLLKNPPSRRLQPDKSVAEAEVKQQQQPPPAPEKIRKATPPKKASSVLPAPATEQPAPTIFTGPVTTSQNSPITTGPNSPINQTFNPDVNPNLPNVTYFCDGRWRSTGPSARAALEISMGGDTTAFTEMITLNNTKQYAALLNACQSALQATPEWVTPYLFCGLAYLGMGDKQQGKAMLEYFDDKAGPAYNDGTCLQMQQFIRNAVK